MTAHPGVIASLLALLMLPAAVQAAPAPAHYTLDPSRSSLQFSFLQAGAQNQGKFRRFAVTLDLSPQSLAKLDVTVQMSSLDTGDKQRDDTLSSGDMFDVAKFPVARFTATHIVKSGGGYLASGSLTIRGVTRDTQVPFKLRTATEGGRNVAYLAGETTLRRLDFGVGQGQWKSTQWVSNEVKVSYSLRLTASPAP